MEDLPQIGARPQHGKLTFSDDFDRLHLEKDGGVWSTRYHYAEPNALGSRTLLNNGEQQVYVDPELAGDAPSPLGLNPFEVRSGVLHITARPTPARMKDALWGYDYTSGLLTSRYKFVQKFGYFEMRARLPAGQGLWPAFWLLPEDGHWPPELDVMEFLGHRPTTVHHAVHWRSAGKHLSRGFPVPTRDVTQGFHTYGLEWSPTTLRWFVDGKETARMAAPPGVDRPMYLLMNLAVGGHWPGNVNPNAVPATMQIDYVRVYAPAP